VSEETNVATGQDAEALRAEIGRLKTELELRSRTAEEMERAREKMRGWLAIALVATLIVVMGLTFWYLLILSRRFGTLTTDDLIALIPMVGTTLLTPLVGLIGAVMGFYYGGQTAAQGAQTATQAASQATQAAQQRPTTEAATEAATKAATEVATGAATKAATEAARQAAIDVVNRPQEPEEAPTPPAS